MTDVFFTTQVTTDNIVTWEIQLSIVEWVLSKTQILLETMRTQNQLREESYVFSDVKQLSSLVGCARNIRQYLTVLQHQKSFRFMLVCEWMDYLLLTYGMCD